MSYDSTTPPPDPSAPVDLKTDRTKKKIAPELLVVGLCLVGMMVVGVVLFVGSRSDDVDTVESSGATEVLEESVAEETTTTQAPTPSTTLDTTTTLAPSRNDSAAIDPAPTSTAPTTTATTTSTTTTTTTTTTTLAPSTTAPVDPDAAAAARLAELIATDAPAMVGVEEQWVPQLSAKTLGTQWRGVTYDFQAILAEHEALRVQYGAILVDGSTYSFRIGGEPMAGWFITLVPRAYPNFEGALAWCNAEQINSDDCLAKLITNRPDPGNTIELNP